LKIFLRVLTYLFEFRPTNKSFNMHLIKCVIKLYCFFVLCFSVDAWAQTISPGAYQMQAYLPALKDKNVGLVINQTSEVKGVSLLDTLLSQGIQIRKIFVPEHGFRGNADAGARIQNDIDDKSGLPIISLYGQSKKPSKEQLEGLDVLVFDLQDVGVRFYTYISTLEYVMEAAAENGLSIIVLDRPNPMIRYVDGPTLEIEHRSFVGRQKVPVLYGMTIGEYALMLKGESWFKNAAQLALAVITIDNYTRDSLYNLPVPPSPNLRSANAIAWYPTLCFFEGTVVSVGRGTPYPFEQYGHPAYKNHTPYSFKPVSSYGARQPLLENQTCYGFDLRGNAKDFYADEKHGIRLEILIDAYNKYPQKDKFFNAFFEKLAGTSKLRQQIKNNVSAEKIRSSWQSDINAFLQLRTPYLLYH
jgi:uncharacterized protein YbbC (DUF1343 family)